MSYITRAQWGARPPRGTGNAIGAHPLGVAVHYSEGNLGSSPDSLCDDKIRGIQNYHMNTKGWADIAYSFIACPHGNLFEGRGTGKGSAANGTTVGNLNYYAVCALGGPKDKPTTALLDAIGAGIARCRAAGAGGKVVGHRNLFATACPGTALYAYVVAGHWNVIRPPQDPPGRHHDRLLAITGVLDAATVGRMHTWVGLPYAVTTSRPFWRAIQRRVGGFSLLGLPNATMWKAIQRLVNVTPDGIPGPNTLTHLQRYLNAH